MKIFNRLLATLSFFTFVINLTYGQCGNSISITHFAPDLGGGVDIGNITSTSGTVFQVVSGTDLCSAALNQSNMFDASAGCNPTLNGWYSADGGLFYYYTGIQFGGNPNNARTWEDVNARQNGISITCGVSFSSISAQSAVSGYAFNNFTVTSDQTGTFTLEWYDGSSWLDLDPNSGGVIQQYYGVARTDDNFTIDDNSPAYNYAASNGSVQIRIEQTVGGTKYYGSAATFTLCTPPTQASNFSSSSITSTTATISFSAGNGGKRIVVARESSAVSGDPTQFNSSYSANPAYGSGASLGGGYVVFNGSQSSVNLTGLTASTTYHFAVFEFTLNGGACDYCYNVTELTGNFTTSGGSCSPYTGGGTVSYSGTTTACDNLNPGTVSCSSPTGGSNGSASYLWEKSTDNGSTWISTSGVLETVNPANLTTTTLFRRGASYCATASENASEVYSNSITFTVNATPSAPTAADQGFCSSASPTVADLSATGTSIQWYSASSGGSALSSGTSLSDGTTYYASQTVSGCESSRDAAAITVTTNPAVTVTVTETSGSSNNDGTVCSGDNVTLSGNGASSYSWDNSVTDGSAFAASSTTTYTVTGTTSGCTGTATQTITVPSVGTVTTSGAGTSCDSRVLSASLTGSGTIYWQTSASGTSTSNSGTSYTVTSSDTYYARVKNSGCWGANAGVDQTEAVTINSTPSAPTAADQSFCSSASPSVADLSATGTSIQWYSASSGGSALSSGTSLSDGTTYYASQTVSGCESSRDAAVITLDAAPSWANFQHSESSICSGTTLTTYGQVYKSGTTPGNHGSFTVHVGYSTTDTDPAGWGNWVAASPNGTNGSNNEFTADLTSSELTSSGTYYLAYRYTIGACTVYGGTNGEWNSDSKNVSVVAQPNAGTLSGTQGICSNGSVSFTSDGDAGGTWSSGTTGVATINSSSGAISPVSAGVSTITYTVSASPCSDATATRDVTVTAAPSAGTLGGTQGICSSGSTTFTSTQSGGTWSSGTTGVATINSSSGAISPVSAGTSTITYTVSGSGGCSDATATRDVTVTAAPSAGTLGGTQGICSSGSTTFTSTQSGGTWSSGTTGVATINSSSGAISPVSAGTSTITYTVSGSGGCSDATATRDVTVTAAPSAGTISGTNNANVSQTTNLSSDGDAGGSWSSSDDNIATVDGSGVVTGVAAGNVTITYTVSATSPCTVDATATYSVTINSSTISTSGSLSAFSTCEGSASSEQNFSVSGSGLTADITVTAPSGFEVSTTSGSGFGSSVTLSQSGGSVSSTTVYVRLASASVSSGASDTPSGNITCASTGASTKNVSASGTVYNTPSSAAGSDISQCDNPSFTLAATNPGFGTGAWSVASGSANISTPSSNTSAVTSVSAGASATLTWTVSNGTCTATDDVVLTNNDNPTADAGSDISKCGAANASLSVTPGGGSGSYTYSWSPTTGLDDPSIAGPTASHSSTETYTVTVTDGNGCTATDDVTVTVDAAPSWANFQHSESSICSGTTLTTYGQVYKSGTTPGNHGSFTVHVGYSTTDTDPAGWGNWVAASPNGTNGSNNEFTADLTSSELTSSGTYYLAYRYTIGACTVYGGTNGEWNSDSKNVSVVAQPNAGTLSGTQGICSNGSVSFTSDGDAGGTWSSGTTGVATINSSSGAISPVSAGVSTITYTVSASPCSDATATRDVTVTAAPSAGTLGGTQGICSSGSTTFTSTQSGGTWSSGTTGVATINSSSGAISPVSAGTSTITYTVSGSGGCSDATATRDVTVTAAPSAGTLGGTQGICSSGSTTFTSTQSGGTWSSGTTGVATINSSSGAISPVSAGTSTITYTVSGSGGCSDATATRDVTVTAAPSAGTISGTNNANVSQTTNLSSDGDAGGSWSSSDDNIATVDGSGVVTGVAAGNVTITYTVSATSPCTVDATATYSVTINSSTISTSGSLSAFSTCEGSASSEQNFSVSGSGLTADITVTAPSGFEVSTTSGSGFGSSVTLSQSGGSVSSTTVYVRLASASVSSGASDTPSGNITCASTGASTKNVSASGTVYNTPSSAAGSDITQCGTSSFTMAATSPGFGTGAWSVASGSANISTPSSNTSAVTSVSAGASATLTWTVSNGTCTATDDVVLTNNDNPTADAGDDVTHCSGLSSSLSASASGGSGGSYTYSWSPSTGLSATNVSNPTASNTSQTTYTVTVTDGNSCTATDDIVVSVDVAPQWANFQHSESSICSGTTLTTYGQVYKSGTTPGNHGSFTVHVGYSTTDTDPAGWGNWVAASQNGTSGSNNEFTADLTSSELTSSGTYYLAYRYTIGACTVYGGTNGLWNSDSKNVSVVAQPNAGTLSGTQGICSNGSVSFTSDGDAGGTWSSGTTGVATINSSSGAISPVSAGVSTITYTVSASPCSDATATRDVTVTAAPSAGTLGGTQGICSSGSTTFTSTQSGGTWSSGTTGVATINSSSGAISPVSAGTSTITYTVSGSGGCSDATATRDVTVTAAPSAGTLGGTQGICSSGSTTFTSTQSGGTWSSGTTGVATINSSSGAISPVSAGTSTITYTVSGSGGCSDATATRDVTVTAAPSAGTISGTNNANVSQTTNLSSDGDAGGSWSSSDDNIATVDGSGVVTGVAAGSVTITYTVSATSPCTVDATATYSVTINSSTISTSGSLSAFSTCEGSASSEQNFSVSGSGLTADITVTAPSGFEVSTTSGSGFGSSVTLSQSGGSVSSTTVYVRLASASVSSGASDTPSGNITCASTGASTKNVSASGTVYNTPSSAAGSDISQCDNASFTLAATNPGFGTGAWSVTSGSASITSSSSYNSGVTGVTADNSATLTWTVSNGTCTAATDDVVLSNTGSPNSGTISGTNSMAIGQTSQLSISGNSASGTWGTSNASLATVSGSGLVSGVAAGSPNITYTVAGSGACSDAVDSYAITVTGTIASVGSGNWNDVSNWGSGSLPTAGQDITILHDITVNTNTVDLGNLTVNSGVTLSIGAYTVSVDGTYDATGGNTTFTDAGTLKLSGAVTSLGTFTKATNCTVEYDGGNQTVAALSGSPVSKSYYNLVINGTGTKTLAGSTRIDGDLTLTASTFDLSNKTIYPKANITASSGSITASGSASITFNNSASHNIAGINSSNITIKTTSSSGTVTTAGNITCKSIDLTSGTQTFVVDGEDVVVEDDIVVTAGTLQLTSGTIAVNSNSATSAVVEGGTLDINGGTLTVGDNSVSDLKMTSGTIDISGGTLTVKDQINILDGTFTQSGGTVNVCDHNATRGGSSADKFSILAGNLNLTGGDLYLRGQSTSSYDCMYIPSTGVTVTTSASHTTHIEPNNTDDEDMYLNVNGNELGNLTVNLNQSSQNVYLQSGLALEGNLTISAGDLQTLSGNTLTMSGGTQTISITDGSVTGTDAGSGNDLTLAISSGSTTTFTGNATGNSDHEKKFFNVNVNSGATLELSRGIMCRYGTFTVDGDLQINDDGYVQSVGVSPTYGNSSTLIYNNSGVVGRSHEWTSTSNPGYPNDVSVTQGSVNLGSGATSTARQIAGDLSISSGAGFYMDYGSDDMTAALTINGNVTNSGTLSLSGSVGGDLVLKGDFAQNGTFNHNSRSVTLSGSSDQAISTTGSSVGFGFLTINNTSNDIDPADDITVANDFTITAGELDLSTHTATVTGTSDVNGTLTVSSGTFDANGTFDATSGNVTFSGAGRLELGGTVTSLGTFTGGGSSTVSYNGASTQTIDDFGAKSGPYDNLDLDGGGQKDLSGNTTVDGVLSWSADCDMTTNGHTLTIKQSPTGYDDNRVITGGSSTTVSVAYSSSSTSECFIPVGIDGDVRDISISAASATAETYTVVYTPWSPLGGPGTLFNAHNGGAPIESGANAAHVNNHYYYDISRSGSVNATLKLKFSGLTAPSNADRYIMHWDGSEWDELTSVGASDYVTALATSFSPFTQGSGGAALPIDLVSFTGKCENNETELEFVVASQENNDYFSIYRSTNATDWNLVGEIEGVGNTSTQMTYKWIDNNQLSGINYYRLSQTDYDGTSESFAPIVVTCETALLDGYSVYPNPANGLLNIDLELENYQGDDVSIEVIDINGKIIQLQKVQLTRGYNHLEVDLSNLPSGVYMINFAGTKDHIMQSRIIKH